MVIILSGIQTLHETQGDSIKLFPRENDYSSKENLPRQQRDSQRLRVTVQ